LLVEDDALIDCVLKVVEGRWAAVVVRYVTL
jgi:hypothetical protein